MKAKTDFRLGPLRPGRENTWMPKKGRIRWGLGFASYRYAKMRPRGQPEWAKMGPRSDKIGPRSAKIGPRSAKVGQDRAKVRQGGAKMGPSWAKIGPRWGQDGPR